MIATNKRVQGDLLLLFVAVIWGSAFVAQRIAATYMGYLAFNGLRFILGAAVLAPLAFWGWRPQPLFGDTLGGRQWFKSIRTVGLAGGVLFLAAALQQAGLEQTTAANAGFITSLYVVIVPILLWLFHRQHVRSVTWLAALVAVAGAGLLSTGGQALRFNPGDGLELLGAILWALHMIIVGSAATKMNVLRFSVGQYLFAGSLNLAASLIIEGNPFQGIGLAWLTVLYIGIFSTALGYTLQAVGQQYAPPSDAAILLSMEAVFAGLSGWLFLDERLGLLQLIGCGLILSGVVLAQINPGDKK